MTITHILMPSELLLDWGSWDIIDTIWLFTERRLVDKWQCTTAVRSLWSHSVDADNHSDHAAIQEDEPKDANSDNAIEEDLVLRLPLNVTSLIHLSRHASGAWSDKNHNKLDQE